MVHRHVIAGKTRTAEAETGFQGKGPDARIAAHGVEDHSRVAPGQLLAKVADHVGEGYLSGDEGVDRDLDEFSILDRHSLGRGAVYEQLAVAGREPVARHPVEFPNQAEGRAKEVANHLT